MYLFGFPEGLAGGSKETEYQTDFNTNHLTDVTTVFDTLKMTTKSTTVSTAVQNPVYTTHNWNDGKTPPPDMLSARVGWPDTGTYYLWCKRNTGGYSKIGTLPSWFSTLGSGTIQGFTDNNGGFCQFICKGWHPSWKWENKPVMSVSIIQSGTTLRNFWGGGISWVSSHTTSYRNTTWQTNSHETLYSTSNLTSQETNYLTNQYTSHITYG